jgi:hypothetical protein
MSYGWFKKYVDECYACLNDISLNALGVTPEGFNMAALQQDLNHIGDPIVDPVPPIPPPSPPTPTPVPPVPVNPPVPPFPVPPTPDPDDEAPNGPMIVTGVGGAFWVVMMDGIAQEPNHTQSIEAVQHADALRWMYHEAVIEIHHNAVYRVE